MKTPWGQAQSIQDESEGIQSVSTSGHGGYKLDRKRNAQVHAAWRKAGGWYEEDCAWSIVVFTFRSRYDERTVERAIGTLKAMFPDKYTLVTGQEVFLAESSVLRERAEKQAALGKWQSYAAWGSWHKDVPEKLVGVVAKIDGREGSGPERFFLVPAEEYEKRSLVFVVDPERHAEVSAFN